MIEPVTLTAAVSAATLGIGIASAAALKGWQGWLELKKLELQRTAPAAPSTSRIEVADLKDRIRRLEAIASGEC